MSAEPSTESAVPSTRRVTVEMTVTVELEVDYRALSEWKGYNLEGAFDDPDRWVSTDIDRDAKWLGLAVEAGIEGRDISRMDGWADFPYGAVRRVRWPDYAVEYVTEESRRD